MAYNIPIYARGVIFRESKIQRRASTKNVVLVLERLCILDSLKMAPRRWNL